MPQPQKDVQKLEEINGETKKIAAVKGLSYTSRDFLSLDHKRSEDNNNHLWSCDRCKNQGRRRWLYVRVW